MSGSSSGSVPSRAPIASAVRSSARHAPSDIGSSVSARWISSAFHPGKARLARLLPVFAHRGARESSAPAGAPTPPTAPAPRSRETRSPCIFGACDGARPSCGPPPAPRPAAGPRPRRWPDPAAAPGRDAGTAPRRPASASTFAPPCPPSPGPPSRSTRSPSHAATRPARPCAPAAGTAARAGWRWARTPSTPSRSHRPRTPGGLRSGRSRSPAGGTIRSRESPRPGTPPARGRVPYGVRRMKQRSSRLLIDGCPRAPEPD